jgi:cephalosporin hydroxylase
VFERLEWRDDRVLLGDLVFQLQHVGGAADIGDEAFAFYKTRALMEQYARLWATLGDFRPERVFELGIFDGGSVVVWNELLAPHVRRYAAADIAARGDSPAFRRYLRERGLEGRVRTYWGVDQSDGARLRAIVAEALGGPLDLVIDDASHIDGPTRASFEALFPLLRPGGRYIIEDWAWAYWPEFQSPRSVWATRASPARLVGQIVEAAGSSRDLVASVAVYQGLVVVERGPLAIPDPAAFRLERQIARRPPAAPSERLRFWLRAARSRLRRRGRA